ncbi:MAG: response regulator [Defluviitaleaceae bacterium]|nr:response regulator [Defluviitaleaceae bacterium]MCL2836555.1 response regulator [Defluviitaleaceae bacterium]
MRILAIDDNKMALEELVTAIKEALPPAEVFSFGKPLELLAFAKENDCHAAFLEIETWGMSGPELAEELKKIHPKIYIVFFTAYITFKRDIIDLRPCGFMMKPVTKEAVWRELEILRFPIEQKANARVYVHTFSNFEVFVYGKTVVFNRSKAKELLAYLVDRQGTSVTTAEIAAVLWEDKSYGKSVKNQVSTVISEMTKVLREHGIEDIIIKSWNQIAVDTSKISCDYYDLLNGHVTTNAYSGEYMANYSWAEMTAALLSQRINNT